MIMTSAFLCFLCNQFAFIVDFQFECTTQILLRPPAREEPEALIMIAYEFCWVDKRGESHFFAILPERRKNPERITEESIKKWGKMVLGSNRDSQNFYFIKVELPNSPRK